jgi:biotin carboxyl carrier protein
MKTVRINGREYRFDEAPDSLSEFNITAVSALGREHGITFRAGNQSYRAIIDRSNGELCALFNGREFAIEVESERDRLLKSFAGMSQHLHHHSEIRASMPGMVLRIAAEVGQPVEKGQPVLILEAMKMENEIRAPMDGIVKEIRVKERQTVEKNDLLVILD